MHVDLRGPAGILEAVLDEPRGLDRGGTAIVCHPHPLFGGTLQNKVAYRVARGLRTAGIPVLRFNFRGVGRSQGEHDDGVGEADDLRAAMGWLAEHRPGRPLLLAGYSFGAHVASRVFVEDPRALALIAVAPALRVASFDHLGRCQKPKYLVVAERDEFGEWALADRLYRSLAPPKSMHVIRGATHAFGGELPEVERVVGQFGEQFLATR